MTIDLDVAPVEPPPPRRLVRQRRWVVVGMVVAVVAAAAVAVVLGTSPPPTNPPPDLAGRLRWVARLVDAPARGELARDHAFARELTDRIERDVVPAGDLAPFAMDGSTPRRPRAMVLFADDIDRYRVVLLSLRNDEIEDDRRRYALTYLLWLYGPSGASPETLAQAIGVDNPNVDTGYRLEPATPVASAVLGDAFDPVWVLVAPPECELATTPSGDLYAWTTDAASYLVRRLGRDDRQYWRATCDGVLREERPGPGPAILGRDLDVLMASAVGEPDREWLGYQVNQLNWTYGAELVNLGQVVWAGRVTSSAAAASDSEIFTYVGQSDGGPVEATVTVLVAARARGGLIGSVSTVVHTGTNEGRGIEDTIFAAHDNPYGLIAVRLNRWRGQVLVLARSPEVASVWIADQRDGQILDEAPMDGRPVMLAPDANTPHDDLFVAATDATGRTLITVELATTNPQPDAFSFWD